jgi:hypothetical protein
MPNEASYNQSTVALENHYRSIIEYLIMKKARELASAVCRTVA